MFRVKILGLAVLSAVMLAAISCGGGDENAPGSTTAGSKPTAAGSSEPIKIGYIDSISGAFSFSGTQGRQGALLAVEEVNAAGGILGRPIDLAVRDDKSSPPDGVAAMRDLVDQGAVIVTGGIHSGVVQAVSEVAKATKTPFLAKGGYAAALTEALSHRYFFRISTSGRILARAMAVEVAKQPYKRACTVGSDYAFGHDVVDTTIAELKVRVPDFQVISGCQYWPPATATDFGSILTAVDAAKPDILIFSGVVGRAGNVFVRQAKASGLLDRIPMVVHSSLGLQENTWSLEKSDVSSNVLLGSDYPNPAVAEGQRQFDKKYKAKYGDNGNFSAAMAYTAIYTIKDAIEKAGKVDKEAIIDALEGLTVKYQTGEQGTIRPFDHQSTIGWFVGSFAWDQENNVAGMTNVRYVDGANLLLTEDEIAKLKAQ